MTSYTQILCKPEIAPEGCQLQTAVTTVAVVFCSTRIGDNHKQTVDNYMLQLACLATRIGVTMSLQPQMLK